MTMGKRQGQNEENTACFISLEGNFISIRRSGALVPDSVRPCVCTHSPVVKKQFFEQNLNRPANAMAIHKNTSTDDSVVSSSGSTTHLHTMSRNDLRMYASRASRTSETAVSRLHGESVCSPPLSLISEVTSSDITIV